MPRICSCSYRPAPTNLLPQTCSYKHAPTNRILQFYCSMHKLSPKHINQALHSPTHSHGSRHTFFHTQIGKGIHSPTYIQSKAYNLLHTYRARHTFSHIYTKQSTLSTTYIQSKAYFQRQTFFHGGTRGGVYRLTNILPQTCCHKHIGQAILFPTTTGYQSHSSKHTFNHEHLPGIILLP